MPKYPINEIFYSLKGEGKWSGTPMKFIRLSGCNLKCPFCDTPERVTATLDEVEILNEIDKYPSECKHVVITGGEPLIHNLESLKDALIEEGYKLHLETNGTFDILGYWDWIAVSPKGLSTSPYAVAKADEVKFLCGLEGWEGFIDAFAKYVTGARLLMPIALGTKDQGWNKGSSDLIQENIKKAVGYCLKHPNFSLCLQIHKYLNIP